MVVLLQGIDPSLDEVWATVSRRYCARHLCKNFKREYPGILMHKVFWSVTNAYSLFTFKKALEQVQRFAGLGAVKWLKEIGPLDRWTRWMFDPQLCSDENTNNFVESFNSTIGVDRTYPILTLLEGIIYLCLILNYTTKTDTNTCMFCIWTGVRRVAMVRHATRQQLCEDWRDDAICPNIVQQVRVLTKDSRTCHAYPAGRGEYEVSDGRSKLPVSLSNRMCICGRWQISGIPCKHGIKAILHAGKEPLDFVSEWYSVGRYKQAYSGNILPIPDSEHWPNLDVPKLIPPTMKRGIGRPSRNRRREEGEQKKGKRSTTVQCAKCKEYGHNALTCKGGATKKEKLAQQGIVVPDKPSQKGKKKANGKEDASKDNNLIELMIAESQGSISQPFTETSAAASARNLTHPFSSQPSTRAAAKNITHPSSSQPSTSAAGVARNISPKAQKILNRIAMFN